MDIPARTREYLKAAGHPYRVLAHTYTGSALETARLGGFPPAQLARTVILRDKQGWLMAVVPASHCIDLGSLNAKLGRHLVPAMARDCAKLFTDCELDAIPPLPEIYGVQAIVDERLSEQDTVYFEAGGHASVIEMDAGTFQLMLGNAMHGLRFAHPVLGLRADEASEPHPALGKFRDRLEHLTALPAMPEMAGRLLRLRSQPHADADDLARVIELDPALAAQILRCARSALFCYRGKVTNVRDAISRVLGFSMSLNIAVGISTSGVFDYPAGGRIGRDRIWRHAVYCAATVQILARAIPARSRPSTATAYLAALLHDFGYLLLGHCFPDQHRALNHEATAQPEARLVALERRLLGVEHGALAAWLMRAWDMPEEIVVTQLEHHNTGYRGPLAVYPRLVMLANRLLAEHGIGDAHHHYSPRMLLRALRLTEDQAQTAIHTVISEAPQLESLARRFAA